MLRGQQCVAMRRRRREATKLRSNDSDTTTKQHVRWAVNEQLLTAPCAVCGCDARLAAGGALCDVTVRRR